MTRHTRALALGLLAGMACARGAPPLSPVEAVTSSLRAVASARADALPGGVVCDAADAPHPPPEPSPWPI